MRSSNFSFEFAALLDREGLVFQVSQPEQSVQELCESKVSEGNYPDVEMRMRVLENFQTNGKIREKTAQRQRICQSVSLVQNRISGQKG